MFSLGKSYAYAFAMLLLLQGCAATPDPKSASELAEFNRLDGLPVEVEIKPTAIEGVDSLTQSKVKTVLKEELLKVVRHWPQGWEQTLSVSAHIEELDLPSKPINYVAAALIIVPVDRGEGTVSFRVTDPKSERIHFEFTHQGKGDLTDVSGYFRGLSHIRTVFQNAAERLDKVYWAQAGIAKQ